MSVFAETGISTAYARNSDPIDKTDIICSIPAIRYELRFLLDIELQGITTLTTNNANSVLEYICLIHADRLYATFIP